MMSTIITTPTAISSIIIIVIITTDIITFIVIMAYLTYRVTQFDLSRIDHLAKLSTWREREAAALSQIVQKQFHVLQHPTNCATARKRICPGDRVGAYG